MKKALCIVMLALLLAAALYTAASAEIYPYGYQPPKVVGTYATSAKKLALNDGPGTSRYFNELGTFGSEGERVHLLARAWDPNNGIWWVKVEYPDGSGFTGWTGIKRFYASSFNENDLPIEYWYPY